MQAPILFFAYANDLDNYLPTLKQESKEISQALAALEDRELVKIHREESADTHTILQALNRYDGRIALFHYAGHAHGQSLHLEDQEGQADGLAQLLSRQQNLQFVFLNGCSTRGQVAKLLELGVRAVIATTTPINDTQASTFGRLFYQKLANRGTLQQSFDYASDSLSFTNKDFRRPEIAALSSDRGIRLWINGEDPDQLPWGLYHLESGKEVLDWTLPAPSRAPLQRPDEGAPYEVNEYIYPVLGAMVEHNNDLNQQIDTLEDEREYLDLIIKNFPWNIGSQISILVSTDPTMATPRISRLEQIISTYLACGQFLHYSLLSQVWQQLARHELQPLPLELDRILNVPVDQVTQFDHIGLFRQLMDLMDNQGPELFIPEFAGIQRELQEQGPFYNAYLYLESIKSQLHQGKVDALESDITGICADAEYALSVILSEMAFLVNYLMITVRDIYLFNPRHREIEYQHQIGKVSAHTDDRVMMFRDLKAMYQSLDSSAIVLLKDLDNPKERLNLTPFFIDKNAYGNKTASATDLYTFAFRQRDASGGEEYYYLKSSHNFFRALDEKLDQIHTGLTVEKETGRRELKARLKRFSKPEKIRPFAILKEQFDHLSAIW